MSNIDEARDAMEVLRKLRNNMLKSEYCDMIEELLKEDFNRFDSIMLAGAIAKVEIGRRSAIVRTTPEGEEPNFD